MTTLLILFLAAFWAGAQNALAGGGSFITLPALMLTGMDARTANITSTVALLPAQAASSFTGRASIAGAAGLSFRTLAAISFIGGALGAVLLLVTPSSFFERLVPWLVLFATGVFTWKVVRPPAAKAKPLPRAFVVAAQAAIGVYGGYFGGGIGFLMLAALIAAGSGTRAAGATKNALAGVMNAAAVVIFAFSPDVRWLQAAVTCVGAVGGGIVGALALNRVNERLLNILVIVIGVALTVGLFIRAP